ncbi:MAG: hypothetical protein H8D38_00490 [DPANN group archaeon]|nr:hypothetical protein [DPANN group archaeon]
MEKPQNLEKVVCELDSKTELPRHASAIPKEKQDSNLPKFYCHDSRKDECAYSFIHENKCYCTYKI